MADRFCIGSTISKLWLIRKVLHLAIAESAGMETQSQKIVVRASRLLAQLAETSETLELRASTVENRTYVWLRFRSRGLLRQRHRP